ncbi:hypothetical protein MVEN_02559200 [Mycena venus]|uniref:Uncharacterized protein n=1 Tax=Mycena venus TaxID=2733690 RepID=A0A8H6U201_9AGAR|nr:hypothetical protein MVEN_02559200 [Mycena venus]
MNHCRLENGDLQMCRTSPELPARAPVPIFPKDSAAHNREAADEHISSFDLASRTSFSMSISAMSLSTCANLASTPYVSRTHFAHAKQLEVMRTLTCRVDTDFDNFPLQRRRNLLHPPANHLYPLRNVLRLEDINVVEWLAHLHPRPMYLRSCDTYMLGRMLELDRYIKEPLHADVVAILDIGVL